MQLWAGDFNAEVIRAVTRETEAAIGNGAIRWSYPDFITWFEASLAKA